MFHYGENRSRADRIDLKTGDGMRTLAIVLTDFKIHSIGCPKRDTRFSYFAFLFIVNALNMSIGICTVNKGNANLFGNIDVIGNVDHNYFSPSGP